MMNNGQNLPESKYLNLRISNFLRPNLKIDVFFLFFFQMVIDTCSIFYLIHTILIPTAKLITGSGSEKTITRLSIRGSQASFLSVGSTLATKRFSGDNGIKFKQNSICVSKFLIDLIWNIPYLFKFGMRLYFAQNFSL